VPPVPQLVSETDNWTRMLVKEMVSTKAQTARTTSRQSTPQRARRMRHRPPPIARVLEAGASGARARNGALPLASQAPRPIVLLSQGLRGSRRVAGALAYRSLLLSVAYCCVFIVWCAQIAHKHEFERTRDAREGSHELNSFWLRKSKQPVLSVLMVKKKNKGQWTRHRRMYARGLGAQQLLSRIGDLRRAETDHSLSIVCGCVPFHFMCCLLQVFASSVA
jgi:hypothetical protein